MRPAVDRNDLETMQATEIIGGAAAAQHVNPREFLAFLKPPERPDSIGRIGHYELLEVLGRGGFGIVMRAFDDVLQRVVAVKVLAPAMAATSPARKRFLREARSSARVRHENVVQVHAVADEPLPYLVMEFIPGETLQQRLDRTGPLETLEVLELGRQIAEGLAAAHGMGLIHRDVKPGNILIEDGPLPRIKITDFGLARTVDDASQTQSGMVTGTPMFMSPEQARGGHIDSRSDLFSLGSVLYTICSGRPPFRANGSLAVLKRVAEDTPRPIPEIIPEAPQWLCDIISRLHAKKPDDRFATAREVADLLGRHLSELQRPGGIPTTSEVTPAALEKSPQLSEIATPPPQAQPPQLRRFWAIVAAALVILIGGLGFSETSGVTDFHGTIIRLFSPDGTLVVEVDDPGVSIKVDGSDIVIQHAGAREIRLKPGRYTVEASKDGKVVRQELVTVTRNGRQVVRVSQEPPTPPAKGIEATADASAWERSVAAMPAAERCEAVFARLKELNPGVEIRTQGPSLGIDLVIFGPGLRDISPLRAMPDLQSLHLGGRVFRDISPLRGMRLTKLVLGSTGVSDLSPLRGAGLRVLDLSGSTEVKDLSPLEGMALESLTIYGTRVSDLSPLKEIKLKHLNCDTSRVSDLSPLKGLPLRSLGIHNTRVSDLSPLKGMPLKELYLMGSAVTDLSPLRGMQLVALKCNGTQVEDLEPLKGMPLQVLAVQQTQVMTLEPLAGMPLEDLNCSMTEVADLSPLRGMKLFTLNIDKTKVTDLSPLRGMPLRFLNIRETDLQPAGLGDILRSLPRLEGINSAPASEFLKAIESSTKTPDRRAAEYVVFISGTVNVNDQIDPVRVAADLPRGPFSLTGIDLSQNQHVESDEGLATLKSCKNLSAARVTNPETWPEGGDISFSVLNNYCGIQKK